MFLEELSIFSCNVYNSLNDKYNMNAIIINNSYLTRQLLFDPGFEKPGTKTQEQFSEGSNAIVIFAVSRCGIVWYHVVWLLFFLMNTILFTNITGFFLYVMEHNQQIFINCISSGNKFRLSYSQMPHVITQFPASSFLNIFVKKVHKN